MFACIAPPTRRTATSIHNSVASAVARKLSASPQNPSSSTGRRPWPSERAPRIGEATKFARPKANVTTPYQSDCSACELVKLPTSAGSTGMIRPIDSMSISVVSMMNGIAAAWFLRNTVSTQHGSCVASCEGTTLHLDEQW